MSPLRYAHRAGYSERPLTKLVTAPFVLSALVRSSRVGVAVSREARCIEAWAGWQLRFLGLFMFRVRRANAQVAGAVPAWHGTH